MANLHDRPLALIPAPQQIALREPGWKPRRRARVFVAPRGHAFAFAEDARAARRLFPRAPRLKEKRDEAYALATFPEGAVAVARDQAGLGHARSTLHQLLTLAKDGPLPGVEIHDWPDLAVRGIHLDLKYMMHRKDYLLRWLDSLAGYKINTLLLEYEDKFPYRRHPVLRHPAAFTEKELREFLSRARALGLRVVPLIQTLGHVEYVLKHDRFAPLRKNDFHTEFDTQHPETWPFLRALLDEVLEFHQPDDWFHVGGDECWHLARQPPAVKARLYGEHMQRVLRHVVRRGKRPLLWDDMVRHFDDRQLTPALKRFPRQTILCYWNYDSTPKPPRRGQVLAADPGEFSGGFDQPRRWADYRRAGFDVLAIPCHDWGPIVPYYARYTIRNTIEMIADAVRYDSPGVINTHWASFHCPLPLQDYGIALTADRAWKLSNVPDVRDFDEAWCRLVLGATDRAFVEALHGMDGMLEMPTNLGRPVHLPHWYYMDSVLHYPNGQADRIKLGPAAPPEDVDFAAIVRRKLALWNESARRIESLRGLEKLCDQSRAARDLLHLVRPRRSQELVEMVAWLAEFREHAARRMLALARGADTTTKRLLLAESRRLRGAMRRVYGRFMHPHDHPGEEASLFDGEEQLLQEGMRLRPRR